MSTRELTGIELHEGVEPPARSAEWLRAARQARMLSWLSLAWMGAEGVIAITAGVWMIMVGVTRLVAAFGRSAGGALAITGCLNSR